MAPDGAQQHLDDTNDTTARRPGIDHRGYALDRDRALGGVRPACASDRQVR